MKPIYIAAYHQSPFGKLLSSTVPQIIEKAVRGACDAIKVEPGVVDVGSIGAACNFTLNEQGLLAGLMAMVPGLGGKPIEAVETRRAPQAQGHDGAARLRLNDHVSRQGRGARGPRRRVGSRDREPSGSPIPARGLRA
jgi:hypothetical protein